jgi:hypothetical protein
MDCDQEAPQRDMFLQAVNQGVLSLRAYHVENALRINRPFLGFHSSFGQVQNYEIQRNLNDRDVIITR